MMATHDLWKARCEMGKKKGVITLADDGLYWQQDGYAWVWEAGFSRIVIHTHLPSFPPSLPPSVPLPPPSFLPGTMSVNT